MPIVFPVCLVMDVWLTKWCWYSFRPWGADKIDILTDFNCNSRSIAAVLPELQGSPWSCICWPFALWSCSCLDYLRHKSCEIISGEGIGWEWRGWRWNLAASCGSLSIGSTATSCNQDCHIKWRSWKVEVFATWDVHSLAVESVAPTYTHNSCWRPIGAVKGYPKKATQKWENQDAFDW